MTSGRGPNFADTKPPCLKTFRPSTPLRFTQGVSCRAGLPTSPFCVLVGFLAPAPLPSPPPGPVGGRDCAGGGVPPQLRPGPDNPVGERPPPGSEPGEGRAPPRLFPPQLANWDANVHIGKCGDPWLGQPSNRPCCSSAWRPRLEMCASCSSFSLCFLHTIFFTVFRDRYMHAYTHTYVHCVYIHSMQYAVYTCILWIYVSLFLLQYICKQCTYEHTCALYIHIQYAVYMHMAHT